MLTFTLVISRLTTFNLPWFMDLTFQVPMQYCSLQHHTLLLSPVTSTTGYCFCFGSIPLFFLELFLHWSPVTYWAATDLGSSSFSILSFCLFILFMGFWRQEYWSGLPVPSPVEHILSECPPEKDVLFIIGDWNAKLGSQESPGVTGKFGLGIRNEAGQRLIEFCQENTLVITNTLFQQHKRRLYMWTSPDDQHRNQIDYILCSQRWRSSIQSAKTRPGADCGSYHELLIAKFRLKLKKVGKPPNHSGMT